MKSPENQWLVMVLDCTAYPRQGLIQDAEGTKPICTALTDISWFSDFVFPASGGPKGMVKMTVTKVDMGLGCSAVSCQFTVEVKYRGFSQQEILKTIRKQTFCRFTIREDAQGAESAA